MWFCVRNKQDRIADIGATLDEILKARKSEAQRLAVPFRAVAIR